jgi:glucose-6-phosphate 1-dehydrogenase
MIESLHKRATPFGVSVVTLAALARRPRAHSDAQWPTPYVALAGGGWQRRHMMHATQLPPQTVVTFGATGDLTHRKLLPAFFHPYLEDLLPERFAIVGYARTPYSDDEFRESAYESVKRYGAHPPEGEAWPDFANHLHYVTGGFADAGAIDRLPKERHELDARLGTGENRLFYCATPPDAYPDIVHRINETGLAPGSRIVFEKLRPGLDL